MKGDAADIEAELARQRPKERKPGLLRAVGQYATNVFTYGVYSNARATFRYPESDVAHYRSYYGDLQVNILQSHPVRDRVAFGARALIACGIAAGLAIGGSMMHNREKVAQNTEQAQIERVIEHTMVTLDEETVKAAQNPENNIQITYPEPGYIAYESDGAGSLVVMRTVGTKGSAAHIPNPAQPAYISALNANTSQLIIDSVTFAAGNVDPTVVASSYAKLHESSLQGDYTGQWAASDTGMHASDTTEGPNFMNGGQTSIEAARMIIADMGLFQMPYPDVVRLN